LEAAGEIEARPADASIKEWWSEKRADREMHYHGQRPQPNFRCWLGKLQAEAIGIGLRWWIGSAKMPRRAR